MSRYHWVVFPVWSLFVLISPDSQAGSTFELQGSSVQVFAPTEGGFAIGPDSVGVNEDGDVIMAYRFGFGDQVARTFVDGVQTGEQTFGEDPLFIVNPAGAGIGDDFLVAGVKTPESKGAAFAVFFAEAFGLFGEIDEVNRLDEATEMAKEAFEKAGCEILKINFQVIRNPPPGRAIYELRVGVHCADGRNLIIIVKFFDPLRISNLIEVSPATAAKGGIPASSSAGAVSAAGSKTVVVYRGVNAGGGNDLATIVEYDADGGFVRSFQIEDPRMGDAFDQIDVCGHLAIPEYWVGYIDENDRAVLVQIEDDKGAQIIDVGAGSTTNHTVNIGCDQDGNVAIAWAQPGSPPTIGVAAYTPDRQLIASHVIPVTNFLLAISTDMNADGVTVVGWSGGDGIAYQEFLLQGAAPVYQVTASQSGSYFDESHDGEGWLLEVLSEETKLADGAKVPGLAVAYWFTYPPSGGGQVDNKGAGAEQAWIVGVGSVSGDTITFNDALITDGASFGDGFDPGDVNRTTWGDFFFKFTGPDDGTASYSGPPAWGSGTLDMSRITNLAGLSKNRATGKVTTIGPAISGSWFDPDHDGEGWLIEVLSDELALIYWFTYDSDGNQAWFVGVGTIDGKTITVGGAQIPRGAVFGPNFDPGDVSLDIWGTMTFTFDTCTTGTMNYVASKGQFGSGSLNLVRITNVAGLPCG